MSAENDFSLAGLSVLVVDDEPLLRRRLTAHMRALEADVTGVEDLSSARKSLASHTFDFVLLDLHLPDGMGVDLLREGLLSPGTGVVVMTAQGGIQSAIEATRLGAVDYLTKPFDFAVLPLVMQRARQVRQTSRVAEHVRETEEEKPFFFGQSLAPLQGQLDRILAADTRLQSRLQPVLITGETGTGKSSLARWLHRNGPRAAQPFVELNCSVLSETLAESELFGHERGAFTDARATRQGLFEAAHGGTLFLDELPSLSASIQAKLLMSIEDRKIRRLGGTRQIEVDVRIIAATSRDLRNAVASGDFREDLLHRLDLFRLSLPPLRDRGTEILELAERLLTKLCRHYRLPPRQITRDGKDRLLAHRWPGNVRELAHELERGLVFEDSALLDFANLPGAAPSASPAPGASSDWLNSCYRFPEEGFELEEAVNRLVQRALLQCGGNVSCASRMLGVTRDFVRYRLQGDRRSKT